LLFPLGIHVDFKSVTLYSLQIHALSGLGFRGIDGIEPSSAVSGIEGGTIDLSGITWLAESFGLIFELRASKDGLY
jgi:hypothetical protein